ncbi:MAG TPA: alpha/beta hydrolase, partial [Kofleriaceae bacterium]|nr:alpha/beta hydrolase [Kofleriaceae bacterium]
MTSWTRGVCETNGVEAHYLRTGGGGPPIVLLHGLTGSGACWTPVARVLEADADVVMPDARGHGGSSAPASGHGYDELAGDVVGLVRGLGLARPVLLGHSMGGLTAAVVGRREPGLVRALVLVDPTFLDADRQREVFDSDVAEQHRRTVAVPRPQLVAQLAARHPQRSRELLELLADARRATHLGAFDVLRPPNPDFRALVRALEVPLLLVIGDTSPVVTPALAAELQRLNARVQVEQVTGAGHGLPFDQPERLGAIVAAFVRELP